MGEVIYFNQVLVTNLRLLGYRGDPTTDMFRNSNPKTFQSVMYFLFEKLDPDKTKQSFRDCWPICEKKDEAVFRRVCIKWIETIVKEDKNATFPARVGPLLISPRGPKFVRFLVKFTSYVMHVDLMRMGGPLVGPKLHCHTVKPKNVEMIEMAKAVMITAARDNTTVYVRNQETRLKDFQAWKSCMNYQVDLHRNLSKDLDEAKKKLKELSTQRQRNPFSSRWTQQSRSEAIEKISSCWNKLNDISRTDDEAWEVLSSILYGDVNRRCLDGDVLKVEIPDILLEQAEDLGIQQEDLDGLVKEGELDLFKFTKFAHAAIKLYVQKLRQNNPFSELETMSAALEEELKRHTFIMERLEKLQLNMICEKDELLAYTTARTAEVLGAITMDDIESLPGESIPPTPPLNIYGGVAINLESPIQTSTLTPSSFAASDSSPELRPQHPGSSFSRKYQRSCSPLLYDPLSMQAEQNTNGVTGNQLHPVITIGVTEKKQWTKVTGAKSGPLKEETPHKPPNSPKKSRLMGPKAFGLGKQTKTSGVVMQTGASGVVLLNKASGAIPKTRSRILRAPVAGSQRARQIAGSRNVPVQVEDDPADIEFPAEEAFSVKERLPRTPPNVRQVPSIILPEDAVKEVTSEVSLGSRTMATPNPYAAVESSMMRRFRSTPTTSACPMMNFESGLEEFEKDIGASLMMNFVAGLEDEGDSILVGSEDSGSLVSSDDYTV